MNTQPTTPKGRRESAARYRQRVADRRRLAILNAGPGADIFLLASDIAKSCLGEEPWLHLSKDQQTELTRLVLAGMANDYVAHPFVVARATEMQGGV